MRLVVWDITSRCNLRCAHCYNKNKYSKNLAKDLSLDDAKRYIDALSRDHEMIQLLGGEPLLRQDIAEIARYAKARKMTVAVITNAQMLDLRTARDLIAAEVDLVEISLDGSSPERNDPIRGAGTFSRAMNAVHLLAAEKGHGQKPKVNLSYVLTRESVGDAESLVKMAKQNSFNAISLQFLNLVGNAITNRDRILVSTEQLIDELEEIVRWSKKENLPLIIDAKPILKLYLKIRYRINVDLSLEAIRCKAGTSLLHISADGSIHPCGQVNNDEGLVLSQEGYFAIEPLGLEDYLRSSISETRYFRSFSELRDSSVFKRNIRQCRECYFKTDCIPCPIKFYRRTQGSIGECQTAIDLLQSYLDEYMEMSVSLTRDTDIWKEGNQRVLHDRRSMETNRVEGVGSLIVDSIKAEGKCRVGEVMKLVASTFAPAGEDYVLDVADFLSSLEISGFLSIA